MDVSENDYNAGIAIASATAELGFIPPIEFETAYYRQLPRGATAPTRS